MASLSLLLRYIVVLTFSTLLNSDEIHSSRLLRSTVKETEIIGADDYPSSGHNSPVIDLGFPASPFPQLTAPPPPPPLLPEPTLPEPEKPNFPNPFWPILPDFPPLPFLDQPSPSVPFGPRFDNSMPSTPSNSPGVP